MTELCELSSADNGAKIVFATNDFYGVAENLLKQADPTEKGLMELNNQQLTVSIDGWVTQRKRALNFDFAIIKLAMRAEIHFICVDTTFIIGNVAHQFSLQGKLFATDLDFSIYQFRDKNFGTHATPEELSRIEWLQSQTWPYLIVPQPLNPGYVSMNKKFFHINNGAEFTHLRLNLIPDGGISRLRVYGKVIVIPGYTLPEKKEIDLISKIYGGTCIAYSSCYNNAHPNNLIKCSDPVNEDDGWHTARSLMRYHFSTHLHNQDINNLKTIFVFGEEWAIFKLGLRGEIDSIMINTEFCTGNAPYVVKVQATTNDCLLLNKQTNDSQEIWKNIVNETIVVPGSRQIIRVHNQEQNISFVKLVINPDGCLSRFRVLGKLY
ncbi:probable allantoicase [Nylanderia fulva]|uniref:probable allantoicase n=1 Tax=Nylanderia fulva TaxID=613905 RepID=UPI0010FB5B1C|nr:probable allantoicase [Nylanderia fulva]